MELLILKSGQDYIRHKDGKFIRCGLDRASVYPPAQADRARAHLAAARALGFDDVSIRLLKLTEAPYPGEAD